MNKTEKIENLENYNFYGLLIAFVVGIVGYYRASTFGITAQEVAMSGFFIGMISSCVFNRIYIKTVILGRGFLE